MSRLFRIAALAVLSACAPKSYVVNMGVQPPEDAHYVVVRSVMGGTMVVYDCLSKPDGQTWEPTCVKAEVRSNPPSKDQ